MSVAKNRINKYILTMTPIFFNTPIEFRKWLIKHHQSATELWVGYYKTSSKKSGITYSQSVDEALCFGWIDGIRKSIDNDSYCNRFTPRRLNSNWSKINIKKVETLIEQGLMQPAGLDIYKLRKFEKF
ncbi:MAG: hypothetical protein IPL48_13815 [Bacteroidetes bacterium]|nr:hypothetical protein [Bacteroidota bacterium]